MLRSLRIALVALPLLAACSKSSPTEQETPAWLADLIERIEAEPPASPPTQIFRYEYNGETVYYLTPRCCDIPSELYDAEGQLLCHPDGGITGTGDGRCPDFLEERRREELVWEDPREA